MILAIAGGKGGVGKSTVALNLAAELGAVAVDADLAMADLPTDRGPDLHDVLAGRADPVEAVREGGPVAVLPCGRSLAGARASDVSGLGDAVSAVAGAYGDVVVDCPAGMRGDAGAPLAVADACVLVATPGVPALTDAVRTRALARTFDVGVAAVALNRADPDDAETVRAVERTLGGPTVVLPADETVAAATAAGVPLSATAPEGDARRAFARLAAAVHSCRAT